MEKIKIEAMPEVEKFNTEIVDNHLVQIIEKYPWMYNKVRKDYRDAEKREKSWQKISDMLGKSVEVCQQRWKVLRDRFVKEKKKCMILTAADSHYTPKWPLYSSMSFLDTHIKIKTNYKLKQGSVDLDEDASFQSEVGEFECEYAVPEEAPSPQWSDIDYDNLDQIDEHIDGANQTSAPVADNAVIDADTMFINMMSDVKNVLEKKKALDEDAAFGLSIAASLRNLPRPENYDAKIKILQVLRDICE